MVTPPFNPFVLPGAAQAGEAAQNPWLASLEMMRQTWENMAKASRSDQKLTMPLLSPQDLEQRIGELRVVENWLRMNLSMLGSTIQALEVQRATIATLKTFVDTAGAATASAASGAAAMPFAGAPVSGDSSGLFAQAPGAAAGGAAAASATGGGTAAQGASGDQAASGALNPGQAMMQGWWDMLQTQFDTLAQAAATGVETAEAMQQAASAYPAAASAATGASTEQSANKSKPAASKSARKTAKKASAKKSAAKKTGRSGSGSNAS